MTIVAPTEVGIACFNFDEMVDFYLSVFSFKLINKISVSADVSKGLVFNDTGYSVARLQAPFGERLKLLSPHGVKPDKQKVRESKNILTVPNTIFITLIVDDIEAALKLAMTRGATPMGSTVKIRADLTIAFIQDPEGNYIELAQYDDIAQYRPDLRSV